MNPNEAIKVLDILAARLSKESNDIILSAGRLNRYSEALDKEVAALTLAIESMKAKSDVVTPEQLWKMAEWFDSPANQAVMVQINGAPYTPGYLLRRIAEAMEGKT